ncbi:hypothetical protein AURDEDRAFT_176659 [Auricularia subglabra TFB-10046 SS5]|uniref:Uncharacterized protein n=1 Tax=Auricularia subglabra (strain TFB-10046 / SS5) TaxID=717982 RepID=J0D619_AURST|nr:hypothetical protein AURDEDRAFT_176659 [Auricularia subglabra TFB-10046 SS5]
MFAARLLALATVAFGFVAAQDTVYTDDLDAGWTFSAGSQRINDNNAAVHDGGYTVVPVGGTAEAKFFGSGASVYFVTPKGAKGTWKFFFDGNDIGSSELVNPAPETQYGGRYLSSHGHEQKTHTVKIVAESAPFGVDFLIANPGPASPEDPED